MQHVARRSAAFGAAQDCASGLQFSQIPGRCGKRNSRYLRERTGTNTLGHPLRSFGKESAQNLFAAGWKTGKPQEEPVSRNQKPSLGLGFADPDSQAFQKPQDERRGIDMAPETVRPA